MPGANELDRDLRRNLREGGRLPEGGEYREARKLFVLLNRFGVGVPVLAEFRELCREAGVGRVKAVLERAVRRGRPYVSISFLLQGVELLARSQTGAEPSGRSRVAPGGSDGHAREAAVPQWGGDEVQSPTVTAWAGRVPEVQYVHAWLEDYGTTEPALGELSGRVSLSLARGWMLYPDSQDDMPWALRRRILVTRLRGGDRPPGRWLRWAQRLPALTPVEEFMLEESFHERCWGSGEWSEDVLEFVGEEAAERWLEVRRARE